MDLETAMDNPTLEWCYQTLEINGDASIHEVERSYRLLRRIYREPTTVGTMPGLQEFSEEKRKEILQELDLAYETLKSHLTVHRAAPRKEKVERVAEEEVTGEWLTGVREDIGYSLDDAAEKTNIRKTYLVALESENFAQLPDAAVYVRGFVRAYLQFLDVKEEPALDSYMNRYRMWEINR